MSLVLWIMAGLLAAAFAGAGLAKLLQPKAKLAQSMGWVDDLSETQVKLIGVAEVLGAVGLILPAALDIVPILAPLATGLVLLMLGAAATHARRGEKSNIVVNAVLAALAAFVAIMRFGPYAF